MNSSETSCHRAGWRIGGVVKESFSARPERSEVNKASFSMVEKGVIKKVSFGRSKKGHGQKGCVGMAIKGPLSKKNF
jgi:hypothetical protein